MINSAQITDQQMGTAATLPQTQVQVWFALGLYYVRIQLGCCFVLEFEFVLCCKVDFFSEVYFVGHIMWVGFIMNGT